MDCSQVSIRAQQRTTSPPGTMKKAERLKEQTPSRWHLPNLIHNRVQQPPNRLHRQKAQGKIQKKVATVVDIKLLLGREHPDKSVQDFRQSRGLTPLTFLHGDIRRPSIYFCTT